MGDLDSIKKSNAKIFQEILELESMIGERIDRNQLKYRFYRAIDSLFRHEQNKELFLNGPGFNFANEEILIDQRKIWGHIKVIHNAIGLGNPEYTKIAMENDGRMFISRVKEQMFTEQKFFGRLLLLA